MHSKGCQNASNRLGIASMVTPTVKDVLGRDPRNVEQFANDFATALKDG